MAAFLGGEAAIDLGVAGAGARREDERSRADREARTRERLGWLGVEVERFADEPETMAAWRIEAEAWEWLAARLHRLLEGKGVVLLHDRRMPRSLANIDHLAVGPGGVSIIDAKQLKGEVRVERAERHSRDPTERLMVGGHDRTNLLEGLELQVEVVGSALADMGLAHIDVAGVLCFVGDSARPRLRRKDVRGIRLAGPRAAAKVAARAGELADAEIEDVAAALSQRFPPAPPSA